MSIIGGNLVCLWMVPANGDHGANMLEVLIERPEGCVVVVRGERDQQVNE